MDGDDYGRLLYLVLLLVAVGGYVIVEYRTRLGQALRVASAWALIFVGVVAGYGLWNDIRPDLIPRQMVTEGGEIDIPRAQDGHFYLTLDVGGLPVRFMADTGASNMVLSTDDARRLGFDPEELLFLGSAQTANGMVRTARVDLPPVTLGPFRDDGLSAWVNEGEMGVSLLGMDYLALWRVEIAGDRMTLRR